MTAPSGGMFLVGRGRCSGYRLLAAPAFVLDAGAGARGVLAAVGGAEVPDGAPPVMSSVLVPGIGTVAAVHRTCRPTAEELGGPALDAAGRPLVVTYGLVGVDPEQVGATDLAEARVSALATFRRFLVDEDRHVTERSGGSAAAVLAVDRRAATAAPDPSARRPGPSASVVLITALTLAGAVVAWRLATSRPTTGTVAGRICVTAPSGCRPGRVAVRLEPVSGPLVTAEAPTDGSSFTADLPPGDYQVILPDELSCPTGAMTITPGTTTDMSLTCSPAHR